MRYVRVTIILLLGLVLARAAWAETATPTPAGSSPAGRFQLIVVPGNSGSPFLIDTTSGCVWHVVLDEKTKRSTFIEVDVENLHWSWGSGAQQLLASRVDASNLTDEQKRALKQDLQKTSCGLINLVLTPGMPAKAAETPSTPQPQTSTPPLPQQPKPASPPASSKPKK